MPLEGPITGGRGNAFGRPLADLAERGYRLEELLLAGEATRYRHAGGADPSPDGRWDAEPVGETAPFRTRLIVYRPEDPAAFNGTVIVSWNNVTAGYDLFGGDTAEILDGGYAFVGVTVQKVGIEGLPPTPMGLAAWDPERYGSLSHPGDDYSFDIFTQAARAARELDGLDVRHVIAMGASQSAARLGAYVNAIQPLTKAFDGFLLTIYFGSGSSLEVGDTVVDINRVPSQSAAAVLRGSNRLRDDLGVPVFVCNSELEARSCFAVRQPDTDTFRMWEVAGTSHVSVQSMAVRTPKFARDFGMELPVADGINRVSMLPVYDAALHHLRRWVAEGVAPPSQPTIAFTDDGEVVRDEHGIATGGIRLPAVEAPVAVNSSVPLGPGIYPLLQGSSHPFPAEKVTALYGDEAAYTARAEDAARRAEKAGAVLPRDVEPLIAEAVAEYRAVVG